MKCRAPLGVHQRAAGASTLFTDGGFCVEGGGVGVGGCVCVGGGEGGGVMSAGAMSTSE